MVKGSILIPYRPNFDLAKLSKALPLKFGWKVSNPEAKTKVGKRGYCGLDMDTVEVNGVRHTRILVLWTDDGHNAYSREDLGNALELQIKGEMEGN